MEDVQLNPSALKELFKWLKYCARKGRTAEALAAAKQLDSLLGTAKNSNSAEIAPARFPLASERLKQTKLLALVGAAKYGRSETYDAFIAADWDTSIIYGPTPNGNIRYGWRYTRPHLFYKNTLGVEILRSRSLEAVDFYVERNPNFLAHVYYHPFAEWFKTALYFNFYELVKREIFRRWERSLDPRRIWHYGQKFGSANNQTSGKKRKRAADLKFLYELCDLGIIDPRELMYTPAGPPSKSGHSPLPGMEGTSISEEYVEFYFDITPADAIEVQVNYLISRCPRRLLDLMSCGVSPAFRRCAGRTLLAWALAYSAPREAGSDDSRESRVPVWTRVDEDREWIVTMVYDAFQVAIEACQVEEVKTLIGIFDALDLPRGREYLWPDGPETAPLFHAVKDRQSKILSGEHEYGKTAERKRESRASFTRRLAEISRSLSEFEVMPEFPILLEEANK